jgi:hypothetical protein
MAGALAVREAARSYAQNVRALQAGQITAEQHRAENRVLRKGLSEVEWERAKASAIGAMQRRDG